MKAFSSGVRFFTDAKLDLNVYFPEGEVCCWYCMMLNKHTEECRISNETIFKPKLNIGRCCPLEFQTEVADDKV